MNIVVSKNKLVLAVFVAAVFSGCANDGNPRSGGIFWSQTKAVERQNQLHEEQTSAWHRANVVRQANGGLVVRRGELRGNVTRLRQELASLKSDLNAVRANLTDGALAKEAGELDQRRVALASRDLDSDELENQVAALRADVERLKERNRQLRQTR
ncbi:MAG: hypothetical protein WCK17_12010 [Verrucomicrobiota bacterium]